MTEGQVNVLLALAAALLTGFAVVIAINTLTYMRGRDLELDVRSGWIEIHKAMMDVRVYRGFVMMHNQAEAMHLPNLFDAGECIKDYSRGSGAASRSTRPCKRRLYRG